MTFLASCAAPTPQATATVIPTSTRTAVPIPTATQTLKPPSDSEPSWVQNGDELFIFDSASNEWIRTAQVSDIDPPVYEANGKRIIIVSDEWLAVTIKVEEDGQVTASTQDGQKWVWGQDGWLGVPEYLTNMKLVTEAKQWRKAPMVELGDLPVLANILAIKSAEGELQSPPSGKYMPLFYNPSSLRYKGFGMILNPLVGNQKELYGQENRWYVMDSYFRLPSGAVLSHVSVFQKDGTLSGYFTIRSPQKISEIGEAGFLRGISSVSDYLYLSIGDFNDEGGCNYFLPGENDYCASYISKRDDYLSLYQQWAKTGMVPEEFKEGKKILFLSGQALPK